MIRSLSLYNNTTISDYDILDTVRLYYSSKNINSTNKGDTLSIKITENDNLDIIYTIINTKPKHVIINHNADKKSLKWEVKRTLYDFFSESFGVFRPWGVLTGIRPTKIVHELIESGMCEEKILSTLCDYYKVSQQKAELLLYVSKSERKVLSKNKPEDVSVYIGIPFCPTVCHYCSFSSWPVTSKQSDPNSYLDALETETKCLAKLIQDLGQKITTVYIGGGTPTSLNADQLERLMQITSNYLISTDVFEFTVEAGRPDSLDLNKLTILKKYNVTRISINPQTMKNETLKTIGRSHSSEDFLRGWELARKVGFNNINLDLIGGLPGEDENDFLKTLELITPLKPESVTFHALAIKRASKINENLGFYELPEEEVSVKMANDTQLWATKLGLNPYYLYRQKNIAGHQENVGFCKQGCECVYNIQIMEERQTIYGLGSGAVTKVFFPSENRVERCFNVKTPNEYILRINEMIERKRLIVKTEIMC